MENCKFCGFPGDSECCIYNPKFRLCSTCLHWGHCYSKFKMDFPANQKQINKILESNHDGLCCNFNAGYFPCHGEFSVIDSCPSCNMDLSVLEYLSEKMYHVKNCIDCSEFDSICDECDYFIVDYSESKVHICNNSNCIASKLSEILDEHPNLINCDYFE